MASLPHKGFGASCVDQWRHRGSSARSVVTLISLDPLDGCFQSGVIHHAAEHINRNTRMDPTCGFLGSVRRGLPEILAGRLRRFVCSFGPLLRSAAHMAQKLMLTGTLMPAAGKPVGDVPILRHQGRDDLGSTARIRKDILR